MARVWRAQLSPGPKFVLLALADHANDEGLHVYPSQQRLAAKTCLGVRTVRDHLRALEEAALLVEVRAPGGAARPTREYRIDVAVLAALPRAADPAARQILPGGETCRSRAAGSAAEPSVEPPLAQVPAVPEQPGSPRLRDPLWDLFDELCGPVTNNAERGRRNRALGSLRQSLGRRTLADVTAEDVAVVRAAVLRAQAEWQGKPVDAHSVAVNWRALTAPPTSPATLSLDDMARQAGA